MLNMPPISTGVERFFAGHHLAVLSGSMSTFGHVVLLLPRSPITM
jgi:hypothetical protein